MKANFFSKFFMDLPPWGKVLVIVAVCIILWYIYKGIKWIIDYDPELARQTDKGNPARTPGASETEAERLKRLAKEAKPGTPNTLLAPRYQPAQYKAMADKVHNSLATLNRNNKNIVDVFSDMYNAADVNNLISAYGVRAVKGIFWDDDPDNLIANLTRKNAIEFARKGLQNHSVYYKL